MDKIQVFKQMDSFSTLTVHKCITDGQISFTFDIDGIKKHLSCKDFEMLITECGYQNAEIIANSKDRKVVKITGVGARGFIALADDGTLWEAHLEAPGYPTRWKQLPNLPNKD